MSLRKSEILALLLLCWAGVSLLWSNDPGQGAFQLSHALLAYCGFLVVTRLPDRAIEIGILPGVALSLIVHYGLILYLPYDWFGAFGNKNFGAEYVMGAIPLCAVALWKHKRLRYLAWLTALVGLAVLLTTYGKANAKYVALLTLGLCVAGWLFWHRHYLLAGIIVLVPIDAMVLWGYNIWTISSLRTRIELWINVGAMWLEKPWFGHGFGSFNHEYPRFQELHLQFFPDIGTLINQPGMFSGSAHCEPLQVLAELGAVGFVLASAFVFVLLRERIRAGKLAPRDYGALCSMALLLGSGLVGFPFQNPATIVLAVLVLGMLARHEPVCVARALPRWARLGVAVPVIAMLLGVAGLHAQSRVHYTQVRAQMEAENLPGAFIANLRAIEIFPWDWLPKYQLALTLTALAVHDKKSTVEPGAADRVFEISRNASPGAPTVNYARLAYLEASGRVGQSKDEIEKLLAELRSNATLQPSTWLTEMWFAGLIGDGERQARAAYMATRPQIITQAGHQYPPAFRDGLTELARDADRALKGNQQ